MPSTRLSASSRLWSLLVVFGLVVSLGVVFAGRASVGEAALPSGSTPTTVAPGSYIVDMGVSSNPATDLLMYGLIYELVTERQVPVTWAIRDGKAKNGVIDEVDFSVDGVNYRGGAFIIPPEYAAAALPKITSYRGRGLTVNGPITSPFEAPEFATITSWPNAVLDLNKGSLAAAYYVNANVPTSAYRLALPGDLTGCDDIYVMPHADPTWATHKKLVEFNADGGYIWAACHAVSVLENVDDPGDANPAPNMNFLSVDGLVPFGSHGGGDTVYDYNAPQGSDPIFQFIGDLDSATENGSEQIYIPRSGGGWRPTTEVLVWDDNHPQAVASTPGGPPTAGEAAKLVYGRGFGVDTNGLVMYEGGHSHNKGGAADIVAAQRAFFNLHLLAGIERGLDVDVSVPATIAAGATVPVSATISAGSELYSYTWTSSCGGSFGTATASGVTPAVPGGSAAVSTTFTAPVGDADCVVRLSVSDSCDRSAFGAATTIVRAPADLQITKVDSVDPAQSGTQLSYTLDIVNNGPAAATNVAVSDALPAAVTLVSAVPSQGTCRLVSGRVDCLVGAIANRATAQIVVTVAIDGGFVGQLSNTATVTADQPDGNTANNTDTETTDVSAAGLQIAVLASPSLINLADNPGGVPVTYTYDVTNTVATSVSAVGVSDDTCLPVAPVVSGSFNVGDTNANGTLERGETWEFTCTTAGNVGVDTTNTATASGTDPVLGSISSPPASATVDTFTPAIAIDKSPDPTVLAPEGGAALFTINVENVGDVALANVVVDDPTAPSCNRTFATLAVGQLVTYQCSFSVAGQPVGATGTNVADVTGMPPAGSSTSVSDSTDWEVVAAILSVDKSVTSPTPAVLYPGDPVSYEIVVTNTGSVTQTDVVVTDALPGTVGPYTVGVAATQVIADDDFSADAGSTTAPYASGWQENGETTHKRNNRVKVVEGSTDGDCVTSAACELHMDRDREIYLPADLSTAESVTFTFDLRLEAFVGTSPAADREFHVVGYDGSGFVIVHRVPITSTMSNAFVTHTVTVPRASFPAVFVAGGRVGFVNRSGGSGANHIVHVDNVSITANRSFVGNNPPNLVDAIDNVDLAPGATVTITVDATVDPDLPVSVRTLENTASGASDQQPAVVDVADVTVINPAVSLTKTASPSLVAPGVPVTYTIDVSNDGNDPVTPTVTDGDCPALYASGDTNPNSLLDPGEVWRYTCATTSPVAVNTATVVAVDSQSNTVPADADDTDTATVDVVTSAIEITLVGTPAVMRPGDTATYTYAVTTGTSSESLSAVSVSDDMCPSVAPVETGGFNTGDSNTNGRLDSGETWQFTCTAVLSTTTTNTATATGTDRVGVRPTDDDTATITVIRPSMSLDKTKSSPTGDPLPGEPVTYQYDVANTGNDPLTAVAPTDNLCSPLIRTADVVGNGDAVLDAGETWRYTCVQALTDDTTNYATVRARDSLGATVSASDSLFVNVVVVSLTLGIQADPIHYLPGNALSAPAAYTYKVFNSGETIFPDFATTGVVDDANCAPLVRGADIVGDGDGDLEPGESWRYTCSTDVTAESVTSTFTATGIDQTPTAVVADPVSLTVTGIDPSMSIIKTADATTVRPGDSVTYTYEVRNTSPGTGITQSFINDVSVTDDKCSPVTFVGGDDGDGDLGFVSGATEVWTFSCTATLTADTTNVATLTGTDTLDAAVPEQTASETVDVINPGINVVTTAGNAPDGAIEYIESGDDVTYTYVVTNTGDDPLTNVTIGDSALCSPIDGPSGDSAPGGTLGLTESWTYTCTTTAVTADITNLATVRADDSLAGPVTDSDAAIVDVVVPAIALTKTAYVGSDGGASCPGAASVVGDDSPADALTYCFRVENTGDTHLTGVGVNDVTLAITDNDMTLLSGSQSPTLAPGNALVWFYQTTVSSGTVTNIATTTGNPTTPTGADLPGIANPTDSGTATARGVDPSLSIAKSVTAGTTCPGVETVEVGVNQPITYCFVVTNTGDTHLTDIAINDAALGGLIAVTPDPSTIGPLAPSRSVTFSYATTAAADLTNSATAAATPSDSAGTAYASVSSPTSPADTARVDVVAPDISLEKTVAWGSGVGCPGLESIPARAGDTVTYCFEVTNTGDTFLDNIVITDPALGGALAATPDPSTVTLGIGDSRMFRFESTVAGDLVNTASVSADPVDADGNAVPGAIAPTDDDTAKVDQVAPGITITKSVYETHDSGASCAGTALVTVAMDTDVTFCFLVANTGDTALGSISITDLTLGIDEADMTFVAPGAFPLAVGESAMLFYEWRFDAVNAANVFTNDVSVIANPTSALGADLANIPNSTDTSSASVAATDPSVVLSKTVALGHDAGVSCAGGELVRGGVGAAITYCFAVTNIGGTYLDAVTIDDATLGIDVSDMTLRSGAFPLAPGATAVYYYDAIVATSLINTATADATATDGSGTPTGQNVPSDGDTAEVEVPTPSLTVDKTLYIGHDSGTSCDGAETLSGGSGLEVTYCFTITNTGDTHLAALSLDDVDLSISEADMTALAAVLPLAPLDTATFYYETTTTTTLENDVTASGNPVESDGADIPNAVDPTAVDSTMYTATAVSLDFDKTVYAGADGGASCDGVKTQIAGVGQALTFCFTVTNTGDAPTYLDSIDITDAGLGIAQADLTVVSGSPAGPLAPGASVTYFYEAVAVVDQTSTATVTANPVDAGGTDLPGLSDQIGASSASVDVVGPAISVSKTVYWGADGGASCAGAESVPGLNGDAVTYCFRVTNTGDVALDAVTFVDPLDGGIDRGDLTLLSGVEPLAPGSSVVFFYETAIAGDLVSAVTVSATPVDPVGDPVPGAADPSATDTAGVDQVAPMVTVSNTVYAGADAGASCPGADAATVDVNDEVVYCFEVSNTGDTSLAGFAIDDVALGIDIGDLTLIAGSATLAPGESAVYSYSTTAPADLLNVVVVSANPVAPGGSDLAHIANVTASDASSVDTVTPAVTLSKTVYAGHDSGALCEGANSLRVGAGHAATYCFLVTNTGDTYLDDIVVTDADLGIPGSTIVSPNPSSVAPIEPGGTAMFYVEITVTGDLVNTATTAATPTDPAGVAFADVTPPASAPDTATVDEVAPAGVLATTVYVGHDAGSSCAGDDLVSGGAGLLVTYCFQFTNTGDTYLADLTLDDPDLGISTADLTVVGGNPLAPLAPGGSITWIFETSISGDLVNTATVDGRVTDSAGDDIAGAVLLPASDPAEVVETPVAIDLVKTVYAGATSGAGCPGSSELFVATGAPITYCFVVTNTGTAPTHLDQLRLADPGLGITLADMIRASGTSPIAPGRSVVLYYETVARDLASTATASATPTDSTGAPLPGVAEPTDPGTASVVAVDAAIGLSKTVSEASVNVGSTVTFTFTVTNPGEASMSDVRLSDPQCAEITGPVVAIGDADGLLDSGEQWQYRCTRAVATDLTNTATVTGVGVCPDTLAGCPAGTPIPAGAVSATATARVDVMQVDLSIDVTLDTPLSPGSNATYSLTARNAGPDTATDVVVDIPLPTGLSYVSATGTGWTCSLTTPSNVQCVRPSLAPGDAPVLTLVVAVASSASGTIVVPSSIRSAQSETTPLLVDNSDTVAGSILLRPRIPTTGTNSGDLVQIAVLLLVAGAAFLRIGRRRRYRPTS